MESLEKRRSIINHIFEDLESLGSNDLIAISNFSASLSKVTSDKKKTNEDVYKLLNFYQQDEKQDSGPMSSDLGEAAIKLFNVQSFSYLQKIFKLTPDLIHFLLKEKNDVIDLFIVERPSIYDPTIFCLDVAYKNSSDGEYYCIDNVNGGVVMKDFGAVQGTFENRSKPKLDIGENPNKYTCPTKIMINKSHFAEFQKFEVGKVNPKIYLITAINLDKTQNDFFKRVTLVMNFGDVKDNVYHPDMRYYFDTYHLCPPGGC